MNSGCVRTCDAAGNMTAGPKPGDEAESDGTEHAYTYDAWNRMVKVRERAYSGGSPGGWSDVAQYRYDGLGRRIVKVDDSAEGDPRYDYYYDRGQVVEEHLDQDETYPLAQYVWHPYYIDAPALRWYDSDTDGQSVAEHYYTHDANFNVTAVMNNSGTVLERYHYSPYGAVTILNDDFTPDDDGLSDIANPYLYTGRRLDAETGLYYYFARYYHAQLGRFINRDPITYGGGDANLYRYVGNRPTIAVDPSGWELILEPLKTPFEGIVPLPPIWEPETQDPFASMPGADEPLVDIITSPWSIPAYPSLPWGWGPSGTVFEGSSMPYDDCDGLAFSGEDDLLWSPYYGTDLYPIAQPEPTPMPIVTFTDSRGVVAAGTADGRLFVGKYEVYWLELDNPHYNPYLKDGEGVFVAKDHNVHILGETTTSTFDMALEAILLFFARGAGRRGANYADDTLGVPGKLPSRVPSEVEGTLSRIESGVKFPHRNDGAIFQNREGLLPTKPPGYYNEYVHPTPGVSGPGAQRIVIGKGGEIYYTPDHYGTFIPLKPGG